MALLDAGMDNGETAARDAAPRKPIGTMGGCSGRVHRQHWHRHSCERPVPPDNALTLLRISRRMGSAGASRLSTPAISRTSKCNSVAPVFHFRAQNHVPMTKHAVPITKRSNRKGPSRRQSGRLDWFEEMVKCDEELPPAERAAFDKLEHERTEGVGTSERPEFDKFLPERPW